MTSNRELTGIPITPGIAIGPAYVLTDYSDQVERQRIEEQAVEREIELLNKALKQTQSQLQKVKNNVSERMGEEKAEIFQAHIMMLKDPELVPSIEEKIRDEHCNAEYAVQTIIEDYIQIFENMEDEYFKARGADIEDVGNRIIRNLTGEVEEMGPNQERIIVAKEIAPSGIVQYDQDTVLGIVTAKGSRTSHVAIMARSLGFQTVMGVGDDLLSDLSDNDRIIIDGTEGKVILRPDSDTLDEYQEQLKEFKERDQRLAAFRDKKAQSKDDIDVEVVGNIGNLAELELVMEEGGEGIGLFRTEFVYMDRNRLPGEDDQFEIYRDAAQKMGERPLVIRTLDIGGDKTLPYLDPPDEMNPFLGFRAIRMCLEHVEDIFLPQLRAILRASAHGNIKIMYPMISSLDQLRKANIILNRAKEELREEGKEFDQDMEVGIMIEVPATAVIAGHMTRESDFFSIGTNDLTQFTLAIDRTNQRVAGEFTPFHPAVLHLISRVIWAGHENDIWVGMCGEAAGEKLLLPFLFGAGLDEFSMSAISITQIKETLSLWTKEEAEEVTKTTLELGTTAEVKDYLSSVEKNP